MTLQQVLELLREPIKAGAEYLAYCPVHELPQENHKSRSLGVAQKNGRILLHCRSAACSTDSICRALGIDESELRTDHVATYNYCAENGQLLFQVLRYGNGENKTFKQRKPDGKGGWIWKLGDVRRVIYNLPEVLSAKSVLICEGEKDCETARALGLVATCNPGGAGKWREEYSELLRGKHITIVPDNDQPGRKHAEQVARSLYFKAANIKVVCLPDGIKDLSDWKFSREILLDLLAKAPDWKEQGQTDGAPVSTDLAVSTAGAAEHWRELFDTWQQFENAPPLTFAIKDFLQSESITAIAGLSGHGKTWVALSLVRALLFGPGMLWDYFNVPKRFERVVYLIPESMRGPIKQRLQLMNLYEEIGKRLFVRTLNMGKAPDLDDPRLLFAVKRAAVVLDTGVRFMKVSDEANALEIAEGLSQDMMGLLRAEADSVVSLFHSPKSFRKESVMNLENMIRGSSEIGAVLATAWGVKQMDEKGNIIHIQNIKPRDFLPCGPFQIIGRPYIERTGDFQMFRRPEECGALSDEEPDLCKGGAPKEKREAKAANLALMRQWVDSFGANLTSEELVQKFAAVGVTVSKSTIRTYRRQLKKES
jgi:hypothetical protein